MAGWPGCGIRAVLQVLYKEKGSEARSRFWLAEGNASRSAQLTGLDKYTLYEIRVLAFTRMGDGAPSRPPVLERTLDDGGWQHLGGLGGSPGCLIPSLFSGAIPLPSPGHPGLPFPGMGSGISPTPQ